MIEAIREWALRSKREDIPLIKKFSMFSVFLKELVAQYCVTYARVLYFIMSASFKRAGAQSSKRDEIDAVAVHELLVFA